MKNKKYFKGKTGVYYHTDNDYLVVLTNKNNQLWYNKDTNQITTVCVFDLETPKNSVRQVAVLYRRGSLIRLGDL